MVRHVSAPVSASASGNTGDFAFDEEYFYVCVYEVQYVEAGGPCHLVTLGVASATLTQLSS